MIVTVVSVSTEACRAMAQCEKRFKREYPCAAFSLHLYPVAKQHEEELLDAIASAVRMADIAIIDLMGCGAKLIKAVGDALDACAGQRIVIGNGCMDKLRVGGFTLEHMRALDKGKSKAVKKPGMMEKMRASGGSMPSFVRKMLAKRMGGDETLVRDLQNFGRISDYWLSGTEENIFSMLLLLLRNYFNMDALPLPQPCDRPGDTYLANLAGDGGFFLNGGAYRKAYAHQKGRPWVVLLYHGHNYPTRTEDCVKDIALRLNAFANVAPVAFNKSTEKDMAAARKLVREACNGGPTLVLSFMPFRLGAGPMGGDIEAALKLLKDWNAPCLHPYILTKDTAEAWQKSIRGAGAGEFLIHIMMPELDGMIETLPVGALRAVDGSEGLNETVLLPERADALCRRVKGWLDLQTKPEKQKKIALVCYNYPPGEGNLFGGAFLDTLASLENILKALFAAGYTTQTPTAAELQTLFTKDGIINSPRYADESAMPVPKMGFGAYRAAMEPWPSYARMTAQWGEPENGIMTAEDGLLIPGITLGNVFIGLQPARAEAVNGAAGYHDKSNMPHHQYAAFYRYLTDDFKADVIVHVGTHGTLEFLPGKETGLSGLDAPDHFTGGVPNLYLYYMGNPSEAMIAKRRSRAVLLGYAPPPFEKSGLYGAYAELEATLSELAEARQLAPQRMDDLRLHAMAQCKELGLPEDEEAAVEELYRMRTAMMPMGLHVFGGDGGAGETEGLLKALRGAYIEAGLAGDVLRSPEVLPGGRNLYQFDPRHVPSPTALERGRKAAEGLLEKYKAEHGCLPKSVALILWGLETSRTQGETVGELLALLGARLATRKDNYESRFELIPLEELGRPRINVTIHICGFFRDMFPNLLTGFYELFEVLAAVPESESDNYYLAGCKRMYAELLKKGYYEKEARALSRSRIFGPKEGEYGTNLTQIVASGAWKTEEQLALSFTDSLNHVYNESGYGKPIEGLLELNYSAVDIVAQIRSDAEYELVDLDHYYEFYGGLTKSVSLARGTQPALYITDTTGTEPLTDTARAAIKRGIRGRLLNPKWIDGLTAHGYHGVQKLESRFENMLGLAATTGAVDTAEFDVLYSTFVENEKLRATLRQNNPAAYMKMLERLTESSMRGYWAASEETLRQLAKHILEAEAMVE